MKEQVKLQIYSADPSTIIELPFVDGGIIVIDKSLEVKDGDFVVAYIDGEFTLKEFRLDKS